MGQPRQSAERLFVDALELEPAARQAFLDRACRGDPALQRLVEELLREDERAGSFLRRPVVESRQNTAAVATISTIDRDRPAQATARFRAGETIAGRFLVVRFIARGGMGEVYEVEDCLLHGNRVALKMIRPDIAAHEESSRRFEQEVLLARNINHPNLCPIYEIFRCDDVPPPFLFLTMKLLTGETLESSLRKHVLLPRDEALEIFRQMIAGIAAIHDAGIVHRDIKPTNVMLDRSGLRLSVSIMDFGLAQQHESDATLPSIGAIAGTPGYLAPELLRGHRPSRASDIYALGVLLHQVLTGERPVESADGLSLRPAPSLDKIPVTVVYRRTVREFLSEDPAARCRAFEHVRSSVAGESLLLQRQSPRTWTRRQMLAASGAACCLAAGGAFWQRDTVTDYLHPLPLKRFVALLGWPPSADAKIKPVLMGLIDSISSELARAEAYDHNLFLIPQLSSDVATPAQLNELRESLGANLVLATSGVRSSKDLHVSMQVLSPSSPRALRAKHIRVGKEEQLSLVRKAVRAAAELLDIRHYEPSDKRIAAGTSNPEAYAAFQAAEALRRQANNAGLERAIENYKQAIDLDQHYSLAIAKLAEAYCGLAFVKHDPAAVALARANAETALALDPTLVPAHMALAFTFRQTGDTQAAMVEMKKALALDPSNTQTMVWQAQIYTRLNRWRDAEECYHRALLQRPNYWFAHNELGIVLNAQGKYSQAESEFRAASLTNPKFALALSNIGSVCLQLGRAPEAIAKLQQSLALRPTALASSNLSAALRSEGKLLPALGVARKATELDPGDSTTWLELGDCSSMVRGHDGEAKRAYREAAEVQREQLNTDVTDGPGWILLALYEAKTGAKENARDHLRIADSLPSGDLDSQMTKARTLEILDSRDEALAILAECFKRGATPVQIELAPDMASLKRDPRYQSLLHRS